MPSVPGALFPTMLRKRANTTHDRPSWLRLRHTPVTRWRKKSDREPWVPYGQEPEIGLVFAKPRCVC